MDIGIYNKEELDKDFEEYDTGATIISEGEEICYCYGADYFVLKQEHLDALSNGKILHIDINIGEYCLLIKKE